MNNIIEYYDRKNCLVQCNNCGYVWHPLVKNDKDIDIDNLQCPNHCKEE